MVRFRSILSLTVGLSLVLPFSAGPVQAETAAQPKSESKVEDEYELQKILVDTLDQVERNYVRGISRRELVEAAIDGILRKLDPYSSYIGPKELDEFRGSVESEFGGIGIQITMDGGPLRVLSPLVGTPAYRARVLAGDRIVEIDGKKTDGLGMDEVIKQLKGEIGSNVVLTVIHPGKNNQDKITITRAQIHVETVLGDHRKPDDSWDFMLNPEKRIGYIRITAFSRDTADELRTALQTLQKEKLAGLVVDLRYNPGGLLASAIEVSDLFVAEGTIVSTAGRNTPERKWDAHKEGTFLGFPMVVLVNRFSASASEIVAACLQDHKRATIMGERTWGKGSVQNVVSLEHGLSALKLTTSAYHRPSGKNIHRFPDSKDTDEWGVSPDQGYKLDTDAGEMLALVNHRRQRDIVAPKAADATTTEKPKPAPDAAKDAKPADAAPASPDKPVVDRLMTMAVDYLSGELAKAK
jgi:carboxyl-terminal processing protease